MFSDPNVSEPFPRTDGVDGREVYLDALVYFLIKQHYYYWWVCFIGLREGASYVIRNLFARSLTVDEPQRTRLQIPPNTTLLSGLHMVTDDVAISSRFSPMIFDMMPVQHSYTSSINNNH